VIRAQNIAIENHIPRFIWSIPRESFCRFRKMYSPTPMILGESPQQCGDVRDGIPQITAIMGMCVAGGAYLPVMCDHILMTKVRDYSWRAPPVQAAIGQKTSAEDLGGAKMHAQISGPWISANRMMMPASCAFVRSSTKLVRRTLRIQPCETARPTFPAEDIYGIFSSDPGKQYDMREIIAALWTRASSRNIVRNTAKHSFAGMRASAAGPSASSRIRKNTCKHWRVARTKKRIEFGGVIYTESAEKAARFILDCNQNRIPLVFLHDVNGFMVGKDAEWSGIIRAGAKMVNAVQQCGAKIT